jgi:cobalt/nickel transport system permease protein
MHLLDHHVTPVVAATAAALALPAVVSAFRPSKMSLGVSATAFALTLGAQAVDVPLPFGASAHLLGGGVLAATFGIVPALRIMIAVVVAQASWGDGGLMALGANLLNIAVLPVVVAGMLARGGGHLRTAAAAALGTAAGVAACGIELRALRTDARRGGLGRLLVRPCSGRPRRSGTRRRLRHPRDARARRSRPHVIAARLRVVAFAACLAFGVGAQEPYAETRPVRASALEAALRAQLADPSARPTLDLVMYGEDYFGAEAAGTCGLTDDGRRAVFSWKRPLEPRGLHELDLGTLEIRRLKEDERPPVFGVLDASRTRRLVVEGTSLHLETFDPPARTFVARLPGGIVPSTFSADGKAALVTSGDALVRIPSTVRGRDTPRMGSGVEEGRPCGGVAPREEGSPARRTTRRANAGAATRTFSRVVRARRTSPHGDAPRARPTRTSGAVRHPEGMEGRSRGAVARSRARARRLDAAASTARRASRRCPTT